MDQSLFSNKKPNKEKLLAFGFQKAGRGYFYSAAIAGGQFRMDVSVSAANNIAVKVIDAASEEEYVLHLIPKAKGAFVGKIRHDYENLLDSIARECFEPDIFKSKYANQIIDHIFKTYADEPEYLWPKFPTNAIFRRKDNAKWYAALGVIPRNKLGVDSDEIVEIVSLKISPAELDSIVDAKRYYRPYHFNKRHWVTICLDGSVTIKEIRARIDSSHALAKK